MSLNNTSINIGFTTTSSFVPNAIPSQKITILDTTNTSYLRYSYLTNDSLIMVVYTSSVTIPLSQLYQAATSASPVISWPPIILTQPAPLQTVTHPSPVFFTISASAQTGISYQWQYQSGSTIWSNVTSTGQYTGSATPALTSSTTNVALQGTSSYRCLCSCVSGVTTSSISNLFVL